jgi:hypothetical protein
MGKSAARRKIPIDYDERQRRIDGRIASASVRHMSNAKWRKLFNSLHGYDGRLAGLSIKFVRDDSMYGVPRKLGPYTENETRFYDEHPAPYKPFREIEFVYIPEVFRDPSPSANWPLPDLENDLEALVEYLNSIAQFPIQHCDDGIKVVGYEWYS